MNCLTQSSYVTEPGFQILGLSVQLLCPSYPSTILTTVVLNHGERVTLLPERTVAVSRGTREVLLASTDRRGRLLKSPHSKVF
jgi:hypothetical protein